MTGMSGGTEAKTKKSKYVETTHQHHRCVVCDLLHLRLVVVVEQQHAGVEAFNLHLHQQDHVIEDHSLLSLHPTCTESGQNSFEMYELSFDVPSKLGLGGDTERRVMFAYVQMVLSSPIPRLTIALDCS